MFFSQKVESVGGITDFLAASPVEKRKNGIFSQNAFLAGLSVGIINSLPSPNTLAVPAMAFHTPFIGSVGIADKIIRAFDPIIQLIQGVSYPVGFIMITTGFLVMMTGKKQQGLNIIKWAAIGYIGMQFAPAIMTILVEVGKAMGR